jgi:hypothetical protein
MRDEESSASLRTIERGCPRPSFAPADDVAAPRRTWRGVRVAVLRAGASTVISRWRRSRGRDVARRSAGARARSAISRACRVRRILVWRRTGRRFNKANDPVSPTRSRRVRGVLRSRYSLGVCWQLSMFAHLKSIIPGAAHWPRFSVKSFGTVRSTCESGAHQRRRFAVAIWRFSVADCSCTRRGRAECLQVAAGRVDARSRCNSWTTDALVALTRIRQIRISAVNVRGKRRRPMLGNAASGRCSSVNNSGTRRMG